MSKFDEFDLDIKETPGGEDSPNRWTTSIPCSYVITKSIEEGCTRHDDECDPTLVPTAPEPCVK